MDSLRADAIVVLGCTVRDGVASPALARRVLLGARAYREGVAPRIIVSGGRRWDGHAEATVMHRMLASELGAADITLELDSCSTVENALCCAKVLAPRGARRVMLATCSWHLPRALAAFRRAGLDPVAPPRAWWTTPRPSLATRLRELACRCLDAAVLAKIGKLG